MSDPRYLTTGSAIERLWHCRASVGLPHVDHESPASTRGTAIHAFLEHVSQHGYDTALESVPDEWREVCRRLNLDGLDAQLQAAAEVAIAYDFETDTARELGRGAGRKYDDVGETEIPCTLDVVGQRIVPAGVRGLVVDWKSGWQTRKLAAVKQIDFGALAASRLFGFDVCEVQLVNVREDEEPTVQRGSFSAFDLDDYAREVRRMGREGIELRERMLRGEMPRQWSTGPWCDRCPAFRFCPAQQALLRSLINRDYFADFFRLQPTPPDVLARLWHDLAGAKKVLKQLEGIIRGSASGEPLFLGHDEGQEVWLGSVVGEGNESIDGEVAYEVLEELLGPEAASSATTLETTKKLLETTIKAHVPRGKGAPTMRNALTLIRERGGAHRKVTTGVKEYRLQPASAQPALTEGASDGSATSTDD